MQYRGRMTTARAHFAAITLIGALALTGCVPEPEPTPTPTPAPTRSATPTPTPTLTPTPTSSPTVEAVPFPTVDTITCETMLDPTVDAEMRAKGWAPAAKPFTAFGFTPTGAAIECPWGEAGDAHSQAYYVWAGLAPGEKDTFIALTREHGYVPEPPAPEGTWVNWGTDDGMPTSAILVTDEWVAFADTPEQIRDIVWAR